LSGTIDQFNCAVGIYLQRFKYEGGTCSRRTGPIFQGLTTRAVHRAEVYDFLTRFADVAALTARSR